VEIHNVELSLLMSYLSMCSNSYTEILLSENQSLEKPEYRNLEVRHFRIPKFQNPEDHHFGLSIFGQQRILLCARFFVLYV